MKRVFDVEESVWHFVLFWNLVFWYFVCVFVFVFCLILYFCVCTWLCLFGSMGKKKKKMEGIYLALNARPF